MRLLNTLNAFLSAFPKPQTARRMHIPTRLYGVLLAGMLGFALLLAGCDGGGNGGGGDDNNDNRTTLDPRAVSNVTTIVGEEYITVSWTNPDQANIMGFNITRRNVANGETESEMGPKAPADVAPRARVTHNITGLTNNTTYRITIAVLYENGDSVDSAPVQRTTGTDPDGGGNKGPAAQNSPAVSNIQTLVGEDHILVGWTNPAPDNIDGFVITARSDNASDGGTTELGSAAADVAPLARVIHNITDLTNSIAYQITIAVLYENGTRGISPSILSTTGADQSGSVGTDIDLDGTVNDADVFPTDACASADTDGDGMPDTVVAGCQTGLTEDTDDDNDDVPDATDAFETDACASTDTDEDGMPDSLVSGCTTSPLTEDMDDDNDGVNDFEPDGTTALDNCPLVANADQANTDGAEDGGDACDEDDDNDGVEDMADLCPVVIIGWTSDTSTDNDGDGCRDSDSDVDDNNNGLIEIRTLDDLARLRDDLNGDGTDDGNNDTITSVGSMGCPDPDDDDGGCVGYELTRSFNFSDAASYAASSGNLTVWTTGSGWQPIGSCSAVNTCTSWTGIFDGGDYTLANLFISVDDTVIGVGLFGALTGSIQNLHLRNARVSGGARDVGTLAGYSQNARYENLSITGSSVMSPSASSVGGLLGSASGDRSNIRYVNLSGGVVSGNIGVGGMIGRGSSVDMRHAYVSDGSVTGAGAGVGGIVGNGIIMMIRSAVVSGGSVTGIGINVGGMVGSGDVDIRHAAMLGVVVDSNGLFNTGGILGQGSKANIRHAYVSGGSVTGDGNSVGGLQGNAQQSSQIAYSYTAGGAVSGSGNTIGGLIGNIIDGTVTVTASYWDTETTMQSDSAGDLGEGHSTTELQNPITFTGIYADWGNFWCDPNTGDEAEDDTDTGPGAPFIRVWDLGTSSQYPALNCVPGGLSAQGR